MKEKKEYIEPELYVIKMEKSIFLAASPDVSWDIDRKDVPGQNTDENDADEDVGSQAKKHYKEYDLWGM